MKLSAAIALIGSASAIRLRDDGEDYADLVEKTLSAETLGDLGDLTLEDLGEEGAECLYYSAGATLLEHGVPEEIVMEAGDHMIAGATTGATLAEGIDALRALGEAYEVDTDKQDEVLGDILGKVKGCAAAAKAEWEGDDDDEDDEEKECIDDECSSGTDLAVLAQKGKGKRPGKLEEALDGDDEDEDEDEEDDEDKSCFDDECSGGTDLADEDDEEDDEEKECIDDECSSGTDLVLAQIRDEAEEVVDQLAAEVEQLITAAGLTEEDLEDALEHVGAKLAEAGVDGAKI